jgi:hypothetical protein
LLIYKTKEFEASFKKSHISDADLITACEEMSRGLIDADYGGYLYKKRIAMPGKGKSSGYRTLLGAALGEKYFFLYLFAKKDKANINKREELALKELAKKFMNFNQIIINELLAKGELIRVRK